MQARRAAKDWNGALRLIGVVCAGVAFTAVWVLQNGAGSWSARLWGALLAAFAPVVIAWPFLLRSLRRPRAPRRWRTALSEVDRLRRAGAI